MPDLVGDNLVFRVLLDKADFSGADPVVQFSQIVAFIKYFSLSISVRHHVFLHMPEQGTLPAAGFAADDDKL